MNGSFARSDKVASLFGNNSIVGKSIVIIQQDVDGIPTGVLACGTITEIV